MKKPKAKTAAKKAAKPKAKGTGPSQRTPARRAAIDKRAAADTKAARKAAKAGWRSHFSPPDKIAKALLATCPSCHSKPGVACTDRKGNSVRTPHRLRMLGTPAKPRALAGALAPLVAETASNKPGGKTSPARASKPTTILVHGKGHRAMHVADIKVGKRYRKDFGDLAELAASINDRGGLIQPVAVTSTGELIGGERRLRAWGMSKFAGDPIPVHVIDVDSVLRGEWDENAQRKAFTLSEAVAIKEAIERTLRDVNRKIAAERPSETRAAPGRKASGDRAGRTDDRVAAFTGVKRETMRKAQVVVEAARENPDLFGKVAEQMDKSNSVNAAYKKVTVKKARKAIEDAPPVMPMNATECATWVIDFPHAAEPDKDQAKIDMAGRALRPYPEMSIKSCCAFAREQIAPRLPATVSVWLMVTNFILVRGYHMHLIAALGFKPENAATMLTWGKDKFGNGQLLRDQTEHAILLTRGKPLIDIYGENPPTTLLLAPRRENSRKPDELWRLVERVTPAKRYASIFSQGGEGENWDGHGDQVGKFAVRAAEGSGADTQEGAPASIRLRPRNALSARIKNADAALIEQFFASDACAWGIELEGRQELSIYRLNDGTFQTQYPAGQADAIAEALLIQRRDGEAKAHGYRGSDTLWHEGVSMPDKSAARFLATFAKSLRAACAEVTSGIASPVPVERPADRLIADLVARGMSQLEADLTVSLQALANGASEIPIVDLARAQGVLSVCDADKLTKGKFKPKLTKAGVARLAQLQALAKSDAIAATIEVPGATRSDADEPHQVDLEEAIAAKAAAENPSPEDPAQGADRGLVLAAPDNSAPSADEQGAADEVDLTIPDFLRRRTAEAAE